MSKISNFSLIVLMSSLMASGLMVHAQTEMPTDEKLGRKILECMQPVNIDDPNFHQGDELFFDIYLDGDKGLNVVMTTGKMESEVLFESKNTGRWNLDLEDRSISSTWVISPDNKQEVRLVARQFQSRWYGEFWFPDGMKSKLIEVLPGRDIGLSCIEKGPLLEQ